MVFDAIDLLKDLAHVPVVKKAIRRTSRSQRSAGLRKPSPFRAASGLTSAASPSCSSRARPASTARATPFTSATSARSAGARSTTSAACSKAEGATWHDIVRTTCYLRDIERDYAAFNDERTKYYQEQHLDPLPASTGIQAILCRPDLLIEIEAIAMFKTPISE